MKWRVFRRIITLCLFLVLSLFAEDAISSQEYRVQRGDTLSAIAKKTGATINAIKEMNHLMSDALQINQKLVISHAKEEQKTANASIKSDSYEVKKGDSLCRIAKKTGVSIDELIKINNISNNRLKIGQKLLLKERKETAAATAASHPEEIIASSSIDEQTLAFEKKADDLYVSSNNSPQNDESPYDRGKLLGKWMYPEEQHLLVKVALGFLGAPYRLGGCSVKGIDCSGFVKKVYDFFDIDLPRTAAEQSKVGIRVAKSDLSKGDLIFFDKKKRISHVGIYIGENKFVHAASRNKGVRVDSLDSSYYRRHYNRAVRLKGHKNISTDDAISTDRGIPSNKETSPLLETSDHYSFAQAPAAQAHR
jgi:cell wall-associated NlpC family hydrolase